MEIWLSKLGSSENVCPYPDSWNLCSVCGSGDRQRNRAGDGVRSLVVGLQAPAPFISFIMPYNSK